MMQDELPRGELVRKIPTSELWPNRLARKNGYSDNESGNRPNGQWSGRPLHGNLVNRAWMIMHTFGS